MRSIIAKAGVLAAAFMVLAAGTARASTLEVRVPFPFVVQGQAMPAGQYRVSDESGVVQLVGERGNAATMFVLTTPAAGHDPAGSSPALTFRRHENQYQLTGVWESASQGRDVNRM